MNEKVGLFSFLRPHAEPQGSLCLGLRSPPDAISLSSTFYSVSSTYPYREAVDLDDLGIDNCIAKSCRTEAF
jgi:hypothetical protein